MSVISSGVVDACNPGTRSHVPIMEYVIMGRERNGKQESIILSLLSSSLPFVSPLFQATLI